MAGFNSERRHFVAPDGRILDWWIVQIGRFRKYSSMNA